MAKKAGRKFSDIGNKFGKADIERLGLFSELTAIRGRYVSGYSRPPLLQGKNMLAGGRKIKVGTQDCYFDKDPFMRLYTGEAIKGRGRKEKPSKFKNVSERPFVPAGGSKLHGCPGDYHGTFGGNIEAFSNKRRPVPPYKKQPGNFVTNPGRKGGPGYVNICLNPYPQHSVEKYGKKPQYKEYGKMLDGALVSAHYPTPYFDPDIYREYDKIKPGPTYVRPPEGKVTILPPGKIIPTGPAKWPGGCHAGCFDKYPEHKADKYSTLYDIMKPKKGESEGKFGKFYPQSHALKSYYTTSVINHNIEFRVNSKNVDTYEPNYIKHLVS